MTKKQRGQKSFVPFVPFFILVKGNAKVESVPSQTPDPSRQTQHNTSPKPEILLFNYMKHPSQNKSCDPGLRSFGAREGRAWLPCVGSTALFPESPVAARSGWPELKHAEIQMIFNSLSSLRWTWPKTKKIRMKCLAGSLAGTKTAL